MSAEHVSAAVNDGAAKQQQQWRRISKLPILARPRKHGRRQPTQHQRQPSEPQPEPQPEPPNDASKGSLDIQASTYMFLPPHTWSKQHTAEFQRRIREISLSQRVEDISDTDKSSDYLSDASTPHTTAEDDESASAITEASPGSPLPMVSLHKLKRVQLLNGLIEDPGSRPRLVMQTVTMGYIRDIDLSTPAVQAAMDAFCYAEVATRHDSPQYWSQARASYGAAMSLVSGWLARGGSNVSRERKMANLASIGLLTFCAAFCGIEGPTMSARARVASLSHMIGGTQYLVSCEPESIVTPADWGLFQQFRHASFSLCIHQSLPDWFEAPEWVEHCKNRDNSALRPRDRYTLLLHDQLVGLFRLLKKLSKITVSSVPRDEALLTYQEAINKREQLRDWTSQQFVELGNAGYDLVDIADLPRFAAVYQRDKTFARVYQFHTYWTAIDYSEMWLACLLLDEQRMLLLESGKLEFPNAESELQEIRWNLQQCARQACQSLPDALEKNLMIPSYPHDYVLQLAKKFLQKFNMFDELHWCYKIQSAWSERKPPNS